MWLPLQDEGVRLFGHHLVSARDCIFSRNLVKRLATSRIIDICSASASRSGNTELGADCEGAKNLCAIHDIGWNVHGVAEAELPGDL